MLILLLIFIVVPLAEIFVFIQVGGIIGTWYTIGIVIVTAIIGTSLLRWQGYGVLARTQDSLNRGDIPVDSVIDGVFLLVAGTLLLTPGLITDSFGFLLFVPFLRRAIAKALFKRFVTKGKVRMEVYSNQTFYDSSDHERQIDDNVIDADFSEVKEDTKNNKKEDKKNEPDSDSPWRHKR